VLAPAVIWVFWNDSTGWGVFLLVWTLIVGFMDNFIRPVLIRRGADLPLLLIFAGVIGGLLACLDRQRAGGPSGRHCQRYAGGAVAGRRRWSQRLSVLFEVLRRRERTR
jgi:hypothetical protein